jgi:hypothetical protein
MLALRRREKERMDNALKGLFGGGSGGTDAAAPESRNAAHDFIQRVTTGDQTQGYSDQEAHAAVSHVLQHASPDTVNRALTQSVNNLSEDQRAEFNQMLQQRAAQGRTSGAQSSSGGPIIQQSSGGQSGSDGSFGDVLGGLLGGSGGGLLGGLLGGSGGTAQAQTQTGAAQTSGNGGLFGSLGELMSTPIGKAVMAGAAAFAMKEILNK